MFDPVSHYARAVIAGGVVTNERVRLACSRHIADLDDPDLMFDLALLERLRDFVAKLKVSDGHHLHGDGFTLLPFQWFIWGSILAWRYRSSGGIRFKQAWVEMGRGGGKSTSAALIELFVASESPGAEIMCLANKADQARLAFNAARDLATMGDDLGFTCLANRIDHKNRSTIKVQASKVHTLDGLKCRLYVLDETSEARDDYFAKVISALPKLRDAQMVSITTPGSAVLGKESVYYQTRRIAEKALADPKEYPGVFAYLAGVDELDELGDETCWIKGNPSLGHIVSLEDYRRAYKEYIASDRAGDWERYQLCRYSLLGLDWIGLDTWKELESEWDICDRVGKVYCGLDLSKSFDLSTLSAVWWNGDEAWLAQWHFIPRPEPGAKHKTYESLLPAWELLPNVDVCAGGVEYERIEAKIQELRGLFEVVDVGLDALGGIRPILQRWQDVAKIPLLEIPQTIQHIGPATMMFEHLVKRKKLNVRHDPIMNHCLSNVRIITGINGDRRPVKDRSTGVIDAIVSAILGVYTLSFHGGDQAGAYNDLSDIAI
jgi:phage terminase large subunit-like protein